MRHLDDFLVDRVFQPVGDWVTDHFGYTPFWLAAQVIVASLAFNLIADALHLWADIAAGEASTGWVTFLVVVELIWAAYCHWRSKQSIARDQRARSARDTTMNDKRPRERVFRLLWVFLAMTGLALPNLNYEFRYAVRDLGGILFVISIYLDACEARPPKPIAKMALQGAS